MVKAGPRTEGGSEGEPFRSLTTCLPSTNRSFTRVPSFVTSLAKGHFIKAGFFFFFLVLKGVSRLGHRRER